MEQVEQAAGGDTDLLMECDEEEQEVWLPAKEEEDCDKALQAAGCPMEVEQEMEPPPVQVIPIPAEPVSSCPPPKKQANNRSKCPGAALSFKLNGWLVSLLPGGDGVKLKLRSHPGGSASGFTTVQIPVAPAGTERLNAAEAPTPTASPAAPPPPPPAAAAAAPEAPQADPTLIITGVVSGEAAQRVLSHHSVPTSCPPPAAPPSSSRPAAPPKPLRKGQLGPVTPPNCLVCMSPYKLITELRGFMCLCSPAIAQSLKNLRRKTKSHRRSRDRTRTAKTPSKVSRTRAGLPAAKVVSPLQRSGGLSDDFLSDQFTSPSPPCSPPPPPAAPPHGKLVIMVEDFYYGSASGRSVRANSPERKFTGPYRCIHCPKRLRNNIKLMTHMQQHSLTMSQQDGQTLLCPHCFRHFLSPFRLQCHLEAVHSQYESTAKCKICELEFGSEAAFLCHMKSTHNPGEMPYTCQVCGFRSSFHSDVLSHFQQVHADTRYLLCPYCLRVLRNNTCYQQHFARHQKKHVFGCDKCRLHFLYVRERIEHKAVDHKTHIKPPQLTGLKPGTKVTVRTYSVVGRSDGRDGLKTAAPCKVVDVDPPPVKQEALKRKPVESLGPLLAGLSQDRDSPSVSLRCVECLSWFQDFRTHFPSLVRCSLCRFLTCCSTSYANHMINNHAACRKQPEYRSIFVSEPRLPQKLRCVSCTFSTCSGDVMANHLTERPEHHCSLLTLNGSGVNGVEAPDALGSSSVTPSSGGGGGAFIPVHCLPPGHTSPQLSVKPLTSPSPLSSPPAMTIKFLGPQPAQRPVSPPLSASELPVVLFALCHGVSQASRRFHTPAATVLSWIRRQERRLWDRKWRWRTAPLAEWLLRQWEQQRSVGEDVLLQAARAALGGDGTLQQQYGWTLDFLLRHRLTVRPCGAQRTPGRLPGAVRDACRTFVPWLSSQIHRKCVPAHRLGSMDEFPVFLDLDRLSQQLPSALQLCGSPEDAPLFDVVLSALSDGRFLPPLLFFRGTLAALPEGFPENVLLEAQREGFTEQERLLTWTSRVWRPLVSSQSGGRSLLMMDVHRGHLTDEFAARLRCEATDAVFIPPGCCCRLQPLDTCVTPVLRDFLQARWTQLVSQDGLAALSLEQLAVTLACWLSEAQFTLDAHTHLLHRSFASVLDLQQVEEREEAARMVQALTDALVQPLETPTPEEELLEEQEEEEEEEEEQEEEEEEEQQEEEEDEEEEQQELSPLSGASGV